MYTLKDIKPEINSPIFRIEDIFELANSAHAEGFDVLITSSDKDRKINVKIDFGQFTFIFKFERIKYESWD